MSDNNYDHPPASSRRPPVPSDQNAPTIGSQRRPLQFQRPPGDLIITDPSLEQVALDHAARNISDFETVRGSYEPLPHFERRPSDDFESDLDTILFDTQFANPTSRLLERLIDEDSRENSRNNQPSNRPRPREHLLYLRNLIHQESDHINTNDTTRALDTLNREIEDHYLDHASRLQIQANRFHQFRQSHHAYQSVFGLPHLNARRSLMEQLPQRASSLEARPPRDRDDRRRSLRSALYDLIPTPSDMPPSQSSRDQDHDRARRQKRRKLDADDNREDSLGFNYGHQGQVVPGALKMEIASCDGGLFDSESDNLFPANVLQNDESVYSTKSDRCNLILRHRDEAPFCLKKIVIKAPRTGFDSPVQEGMVFVSMTSDELLARTARYQIQYSEPPQRRSHRRFILPSEEYLSGNYRSRTAPGRLDRTVLIDPDSNQLGSSQSGSTNVDPQTEFRITTEYSDTVDEDTSVEREDEDFDTSANTDIERANDPEDVLFSDTDDNSPSDDDEDDHPMSQRRLDIQRLNDTPQSRRDRQRFENQHSENQRRLWASRQNSDQPHRRRHVPSLVDPIRRPPISSPVMPGTSEEVLKPYARFFIRRENSVVSIKFDPPPSGRFILIKLWSTSTGSNIDIQSIISHGYAGPRFFPSGGLR
ncbi:hypothetical protein N7466_006893 [Penicillium verhagenii]|uniref:uncharacterized protein n=1 Tax=Penicillium verhagenii TaxID=1562060 RepID=UPI002545BB43|nr:uncharacterized protein N7466_006893 [Penicillium verhagenii]KAJ5927937.1 hypothetical protein N7466_006893 [Penicillium verhagenii]